MKVLVLLGGTSNEREVSLRSGRAVVDALLAGGHEVAQYDPKDGSEGLSDFVGKIDCVFPILHGKGGEDGEIQSELEKLSFKYLGADSKVSKLCFNKVMAKKKLEELQIATPRWAVVNKETIQSSDLTKAPYILKPIEGGSSIDLQIVRNPLTQEYDLSAFDQYEEMLLEELVEGAEITIPILGDKSLPVIEIVPPEGEEFDYENKYNGETQEICPPRTVPEEKQLEAQKLTEKIHREFGMRHLSRTDIMIDTKGKLFTIDLNTMPGLTPQSLFPKAASVAGMNMAQLVQKFLDLVEG
jgi:D-alanine-D-alanine ligase